MANTRLFDSWQIGMDLPAPFDRAIDGGVRYSTKEEDCSCYNKATRGKKATLFPVVLRAVLNLMRGGLNDGNIAAFYCMEYTKAYQGKEMDCVIIYNPKNGRFKEGIIATPELGTAFSMEMKDQHMAVPLPVLAGQNTGEKLVALLAYASIEEYGPLFDAEFHYYYQQLKAMHDNNDVDVSKLFGQIYELVIGKESNGFTILEIMYSVGLVVGIIIFFNHFGKKRFTVDPTPMEVQMRLYENDIQTTLVEDAARRKNEIDLENGGGK